MWDKLIALVDKVRDSVTPEDFADAKKLAEDILRHVVSDVPDPTTTAELAAMLIEGDQRVQRVSDWFVNRLGKRIEHAVTQEMTEAPSPSLAGALARLQQ